MTSTNAIASLLARAAALPARHRDALAEHLLPLFASDIGGLQVLGLAAEQSLEAATTALATFERQCAHLDSLPPHSDRDLAAIRAMIEEAGDAHTVVIMMPDLRDPNFEVIEIPAHGAQGVTYLVEARSGGMTSGLCVTTTEAQQRIEILRSGGTPATQAPRGQANRREMLKAWAWLQTNIPRGHSPLGAVEAALDAGLHTVAWAVASRAVADLPIW